MDSKKEQEREELHRSIRDEIAKIIAKIEVGA